MSSYTRRGVSPRYFQPSSHDNRFLHHQNGLRARFILFILDWKLILHQKTTYKVLAPSCQVPQQSTVSFKLHHDV